jgi:benzoyl-CoA 2,3-dioxygenase component B
MAATTAGRGTRCADRRIGAFTAIGTSPAGGKLSAEEWEQRKGEWLPTDVQKTYGRSLMQPVLDRGKIAAWIASPRHSINGKPFDCDYVHLS